MEQGCEESRADMVRVMLQKGLDISVMAQISDLSEEEINSFMKC